MRELRRGLQRLARARLGPVPLTPRREKEIPAIIACASGFLLTALSKLLRLQPRHQKRQHHLRSSSDRVLTSLGRNISQACARDCIVLFVLQLA
jgi:hypothetical protein